MKLKSIAIIGLGLLLASAAQANQEQLLKSITETHVETTRTSEQLKSALASLNQLTKQSKGDLKPLYDTFCSEITATKAAAEATQKRIEFMGGDGRKYFQDWQTTVGSISNPSLRKKAQKRLDSAQESYGKVEASMKKAADKFKPFLSDLTDVQKSLATDLTAGGVKAVRSTVKSANWDYQYVEEAINSALKEMGKMERALSSQA
jgi:hypothetical protein